MATRNVGWWLAAAFVLILPTYIVWKYPDQYTPAVATLLNAILFVFALQFGRIGSVEAATKQANARWLPQAASACSRLLTVWASVKSFQGNLSTTCVNARRELPELESDRLRAVRTMLNSHCSSGSARLNDVANHLEDALTDWQRFIAANCEGNECERISLEIFERRQALESQFPQSDLQCGDPLGESPTVPTTGDSGEPATSPRTSTSA